MRFSHFFDIAKFIGLFGFLFISMSGCKENSAITEKSAEIKSEWQLNTSLFPSDESLLNSVVSNDTLTVVGSNYLFLFDSSSLTPSSTTKGKEVSSFTSKPAFANNFWMLSGSNGIQFKLSSAVYSVGTTPWSIRLHELDSTYSTRAFALPNYYTNPIGAFNSQNLFCSAVRDTDGASFCLIELNASYALQGGVSTANISPSVKKIVLSGISRYIMYVPFITSHNEKFFVSSDRGNFIVYPDGTYRDLTQITDYLCDLFAYHDTLYVLTWNQTLYRSTDEGENWSFFAANFPSVFSRSFYVGDEVYFYVYSQIFHTDFVSGEIKELDNSGLENSKITSINKFGDIVYVTTLNGMFYKPVSDFVIYKPPTTVSNQRNRIDALKMVIQK